MPTPDPARRTRRSSFPRGSRSAAALPKGTIAARVDGELRDLSFVPAADADVEPVDAAHPTTGCTCCGTRPRTCSPRPCADLWPGHAATRSGPPIDRRLLLRLRPARAHVSADDLPRRSTRRMRADRGARTSRFVREEVSRDGGARAAGATSPSRSRSSRASARAMARAPTSRRQPATPSRSTRNDALGRPVPGPARAVTPGALGRVQAHGRRRRLLARRRAQPAADAHLRHGLGDAGRPRRAPATGSRRPSAATTGARRRARPVLVPRGDRLGARGLPSARRPGPPADGGLLAPAPRGGRLRVRELARTSRSRSCSRRAGTSSGSPTACSRRWSSTAAPSTT